jgi:Uma2 family endonuclease
MAAASELITVEEYLSQIYEPDCDFVDGHLEERNLGEFDHSWLQTLLSSYFFNRRKQWKITPVVEQRIQVRPGRYRVPDICVLLGPKPTEQVLTKPPFLCVEILSPEDRLSRVQTRIQDYLELGVPYVWVLDPQTRVAYNATPDSGLRQITDGVLRTENPRLEVPLSEVFE